MIILTIRSQIVYKYLNKEKNFFKACKGRQEESSLYKQIRVGI